MTKFPILCLFPNIWQWKYFCFRTSSWATERRAKPSSWRTSPSHRGNKIETAKCKFSKNLYLFTNVLFLLFCPSLSFFLFSPTFPLLISLELLDQFGKRLCTDIFSPLRMLKNLAAKSLRFPITKIYHKTTKHGT